MSREQIQQLMQGFRDAAGRRDIASLMNLYDEGAVAISPVFGEVHGRHSIGAAWEALFSRFADFAFKVSDVMVDGDRVVVLGKATATDRIGWLGFPATGDTIDYRLALLLTFSAGKIIRDERIFDSTGVMARLEKAHLDREMKTAAEMQRALCSRTRYKNPFCEVTGDSVPCRAIGGDFFEFVELPSGAVGLVIADIAGKGPAAALLAAMLQGMFAIEAASGCGPAMLLTRLNRRMLERRLTPRFATLTYAELSPDGQLVYSNAGHNPPILLTHNSVRRLTAGGRILGVFADATFEEEILHLEDRDTLVMFTDGVIEARNAQDRELGEEGLLESLRYGATEPVPALLSRVLRDVREFSNQVEQRDDVTVGITRFLQR